MHPRRTSHFLAAGVAGGVGAILFLAVPQLRDAIPATTASWVRVVGWFAGLAVLGLGIRWVVNRGVRHRWVGTVVGALPLTAFAVWSLAPAFYDRTVNDPFPVAAADAAPSLTPSSTPTTLPAPTTLPPATTRTVATTAASPAPTPTAPSPTTGSVDQTTSAPTSTTTTTTSATSTTVAVAAPSAPPPPADAAPVLLGSGSLRGLAGHEASGTVLLYRLADGRHVLRFEGLHVERAPDLHVYLVPGSHQTDTAGGVHLAKLKGNKGNQNYEIPAGIDVERYDGVLIWCKRFTIQVAGAPLA